MPQCHSANFKKFAEAREVIFYKKFTQWFEAVLPIAGGLHYAIYCHFGRCKKSIFKLNFLVVSMPFTAILDEFRILRMSWSDFFTVAFSGSLISPFISDSLMGDFLG
jgi:hypothetical protein